MKRIVKFASIGAAVAAFLVAGTGKAQAQAAFRGDFRGPHGRFSVNVGSPFAIGSFVPHGERVYLRRGYGYGFDYQSRWIPVRQDGSQWIVCERPEFVDEYARPLIVEEPVYESRVYGGYSRPYAGYRAYGYARPSEGRYRSDRRFSEDSRSFRDQRGSRDSRQSRQSRQSRPSGNSRDRRNWR